jgi:hypothetical protein
MALSTEFRKRERGIIAERLFLQHSLLDSVNLPETLPSPIKSEGIQPTPKAKGLGTKKLGR